MIKYQLLLIINLIISINLFGQKNAGVFFGANMPQFYRANNEIVRFPFIKPKYSWQAGIFMDIVDTKKYSLKLELAYNNKGAKEKFSDDLNNTLESEADLTYGQINLFPIVYKPLGAKKISPFISIGGYYSYLINARYKTKVKNTTYFIDETAKSNTLKEDYGVNLALGLNYKKISLEYRIEAGIPKILNQSETLSTIKNKTHSIIITFK